jgi:DNA-binding response OmpR family regulator
MKILFVEDNARLAELTQKNLKNSGIVCDIASNLEDAKHQLKSFQYDAAVLDINLPDGNGLDFLKQIRKEKNQLPVIILTANLDFDIKIEGLDIGADDFLTKPFKIEELVARLRAILRRPKNLQDKDIQIKNVLFNTSNFELKISGNNIDIHKKECQVLELLMKKYNQVVTKNELEDKLYQIDRDIQSNSLEVAIHRLRKVLEDGKSEISITNIRGVGYKLA